MYKRYPNLKAYRDPNDQRLPWMRDVFLLYLDQWKTNVTNRPGFTKEQKQTMFLSWQTYEGYQITTNSLVNIVQFLLSAGFSSVLTDDAECVGGVFWFSAS